VEVAVADSTNAVAEGVGEVEVEGLLVTVEVSVFTLDDVGVELGVGLGELCCW
jgi:hypothetical protein